MSASGRHSDFIDRLCIALAHRWEPERLFVILTAYFDESGTHAGSPATIMSGVMGTTNQWARFQASMHGIKRRYGFTVFHAKEFKATSGEFAGWPWPKYSALLKDLVIPASKLMDAVTVVLPNDDYEAFYKSGEPHRRLKLDTKYALCFRFALLYFIVQATKRLSTHKKWPSTKLHVVLEGGHRNAGDAERVFNDMRVELEALGVHFLESIVFSKKSDPIAIADYLAYGGLAMEIAGKTPGNGEYGMPEERGVTGMMNLKLTPNTLAALRADFLEQLKKTRKPKFIGRASVRHRASGQSA